MIDGDTYAWLRIAATLGCSIGEAQQRIPSSEFNLWIAYFNQDDKDKWSKGSDPMHYYMAQLTATVANILSSKPIDANKFLLDLNDETTSKNNAHQHKSILLGMLGIDETNC